LGFGEPVFYDMITSAKDKQNDYNPMDLENNLALLDQKLRASRAGILCPNPAAITELLDFMGELSDISCHMAKAIMHADDQEFSIKKTALTKIPPI
jgi:hypothetical protein